ILLHRFSEFLEGLCLGLGRLDGFPQPVLADTQDQCADFFFGSPFRDGLERVCNQLVLNGSFGLRLAVLPRLLLSAQEVKGFNNLFVMKDDGERGGGSGAAALLVADFCETAGGQAKRMAGSAWFCLADKLGGFLVAGLELAE